MTLTNNTAPLLCYFKLCKSFQSHRWVQTGVTVRKAQFCSKSAIFVPCDLETTRMTLKNNRAHLLCYFKIWASFHSHLWIQTRDTVWKIPILGKNHFFFALWPWNLMNNLEIGHLFYATSIFMHHFIAICDFKLEIQSGNDQFGLKSTIFFSHVTLKFDRWPWKSIGHHS